MRDTFFALFLAASPVLANADTTPPPPSVTAPADPSEDIDAIIKSSAPCNNSVDTHFNNAL